MNLGSDYIISAYPHYTLATLASSGPLDKSHGHIYMVKLWGHGVMGRFELGVPECLDQCLECPPPRFAFLALSGFKFKPWLKGCAGCVWVLSVFYSNVDPKEWRLEGI